MKNIVPGFRTIAETGVIYVINRANAQGYAKNRSQWSNLGQGSPESTPLEGAPKRISNCSLSDLDLHRYAEVAGKKSLREAVAHLYNSQFRQGHTSKYTWKNVCIAGGGRQALTRLIASLDQINMGHFLPDYTAYEELLGAFKHYNPIPILLEREKNYTLTHLELKKLIQGLGLRALLISNPCNPTGQVTQGSELKAWMETARQTDCSFIMDEFYSHYIYQETATPTPHSCASYIHDVNKDPIIVVDGLTKNWRYPGWRISWILGPESLIKSISSAGSFLDGGANHPFQQCAEALLTPEHCAQETQAIHTHFKEKKAYMIRELKALGIKINIEPKGGFYIWSDVSQLPSSINTAKKFFEAGLIEQVITVPGYYFDVNPGGRRSKHKRYTDHVRISFGPDLTELKRGIAALHRVIKNAT